MVVYGCKTMRGIFMLYIQESLGPNEELIHIGKFHWTYMIGATLSVVWGALFALGIIWASVFMYQQLGKLPPSISFIDGVHYLHPGFRIAAFFALILGVLGYTARVVHKNTTEIAITNSRIVIKQGLISRQTGEIDVQRIEGVNVVQSVFGRMLGYGRVFIRGMGVGEVVMPPIADPVSFRKAIDEARALYMKGLMS